ncbi:MAG: M48 family metallopeptidase [Burkholderiales bacterium]|jgi:predicted Zn-dependent protease|nr:M48 family metallopeptidase [Burkholderiales bacterium]
MTDWSNPEVDDSVNVSRTHPLVDFARLAGGLLGLLIVAMVVLMLLAQTFAKRIPFEVERRVADDIAERFSPTTGPVPAYLQRVADRLVQAQPLPVPMQVRVHWQPEATINAFATLGGHVVVFGGLLRDLPDENTLAMVLAHEIAHVRHRHPIGAAGRQIVIGLGLALLSVGSGSDIVSGALGPAGLVTALAFTREQERQADASGLDMLVAAYGHAGGAADTFRVLERATRDRTQPPAILRSHPLDADRVAAIDAWVRARGFTPDGPRTPLPADVVAAARAVDDASDAPVSPH